MRGASPPAANDSYQFVPRARRAYYKNNPETRRAGAVSPAAITHAASRLQPPTKPRSAGRRVCTATGTAHRSTVSGAFPVLPEACRVS